MNFASRQLLIFSSVSNNKRSTRNSFHAKKMMLLDKLIADRVNRISIRDHPKGSIQMNRSSNLKKRLSAICAKREVERTKPRFC